MVRRDRRDRIVLQKVRNPLNSKSISPAACRCSACNWNIDKRMARKLVWLRARLRLVRVSVEYNHRYLTRHGIGNYHVMKTMFLLEQPLNVSCD